MSTENFEFTKVFEAGAIEATRDDSCEVLFSEICRLYRFDAPSSEWKERGVGDIKVLHDTTTNDYYVVQRRSVTMKLSAYFFCDPAMEIKSHAGSDKAFTFTAYDYSYDDNKAVGEAHVLAAMFKSAETATKFKEAFEQGQEGMKNKETAENSESEKESSEKENEVEELVKAVEDIETDEKQE